MKTFVLSIFVFLLVSSLISEPEDTIYINYAAAVENASRFQYFLVIRVKDLNTNKTMEYCTKGNFLRGALEREYDNVGPESAAALALSHKNRYFEFKDTNAIANLTFWPYTSKELSDFEKKEKIDNLAALIKKNGEWEKEIPDKKTMRMYAHALFNRGILTGESSCWGGTLVYISPKSRDEY